MTDAQQQATEKRVAVRVEPSLYSELQKVADRKYEGKWAMAARAAFRLLIEREAEEERTAA